MNTHYRNITYKLLLLISCFLLTAMAPDNRKNEVSPFNINTLRNQEAPDFTLNDLNGNAVSLSSLNGKIVLLNFWATWCPPCKAEMPSLNQLYKEMKSSGLEVVAVSTDTSPKKVKKYIANKNFDFTVVMDERESVFRKYGVFSLPTTFLIDREGIIVDIFIGEYNWTDSSIKERLKQL